MFVMGLNFGASRVESRHTCNGFVLDSVDLCRALLNAVEAGRYEQRKERGSGEAGALRCIGSRSGKEEDAGPWLGEASGPVALTRAALSPKPVRWMTRDALHRHAPYAIGHAHTRPYGTWREAYLIVLMSRIQESGICFINH